MKSTTLPLWLQQTTSVALPRVGHNRWSGKDYLEKTLKHVNRILAEDAHATALTDSQGILQGITTPVKLLGMLILIIAASLTKSLAVLLFFNIVVFFTALQSGLGCRSFTIRVFIPTLFFVGLAVLPGVINWVTPGQALYTVYTGVLWKFGYFTLPTELTITKQGLQAGGFVVLRAAASLGVATLFIKTTRWSLVTKALAKLGLPTEIVTVLDLTYRYMYLFLLLLADYLMGRRSRLVGVETEAAKISWVGGTIAAFLQLTLEYSEDLHFAMQSRGYCGQPYATEPLRWQRVDAIFLAVVVILCTGAIWGNF